MIARWVLAALLLNVLPAVTNAALAQTTRLRAADIDTIGLHRTATRIAYGKDSLQFGELRLPDGKGPFPVAVIIHGGCYFSKYATLRNTAALADALTDAGVATWNVEYRRYDHPGGGWPGTFTDVAQATDYLRTLGKLHPLDLSRVITMGHSAGGQLALWIASSSPTGKGSPLHRDAPVKISGVVALGPIVDMREYQTRQLKSCGNPAIESVLGGMPGAVADRTKLVSPIELLPLRVPTVLVAGDQDGIAPVTAINAYATAARLKGDRVQIFTAPGEGHFDVLAPFRLSGKAAIAQALALLGVDR